MANSLSRRLSPSDWTLSKSTLITFVILALIVAIFRFFNPLDLQAVQNEDTSDFVVYQNIYEQLNAEMQLSTLQGLVPWEPGFTAVFALSALIGLSFDSFILAQSTFLACAYYCVAAAALERRKMALFATILFIALPFFSSFSLVILRQSLSFSVLLIALTLFIKGRNRWAWIALATSVLFHLSGLVFVLAVILARSDLSRRRWVKAMFLIIFIAYAAGVSSYIFTSPILYVVGLFGLEWAGFTSTDYVVGTKLAFLGATVATLLPGWFMRRRGSLGYLLLFRLALWVTAIYMIASGIPFHDRFAIVSYCLAPILAIGLLERLRFRTA